MRIEANEHPAAYHIQNISLNGARLDHVQWIDPDTNEACIYLTDGNGKFRVKDGKLETHVVHGVLSFSIEDKHRHLLQWRP